MTTKSQKSIIMSEENLTANPQQQERPAFLTVLCVLTFIGSGLGVLGGITSLLGSSFLSFLPGTMKGASMMANSTSLLASILCLIGAIRMWGLHKSGFSIYVIGAIISIAASILAVTMMKSSIHAIINNSTVEMNSQAGEIAQGVASVAIWMSVVWSVIINVLFIILYGVNRKHLIK